jgi:hypothetical protein
MSFEREVGIWVALEKHPDVVHGVLVGVALKPWLPVSSVVA